MRAPHSPVRSMGREALVRLTQASWPGNVRQLANVIERSVAFGVSEVIDVEHLSDVPVAAPGRAWPFAEGERVTLRELSQTYTDWVLTQTGGDKRRAAELLGVNVTTIYRERRRRDRGTPDT